MWSNEDSDGEETVSGNYLSGSGPQFSAQAQYHVNYGDAVIDSMLEEKDKSEDRGVTTCTQPCTTDETMKSDVDLLLALLPQTTWEKDLLIKSFSNLPPKTLFKDYTRMSPTAILDLFLVMKW